MEGDYSQKGYTKAEVEILLTLRELDNKIDVLQARFEPVQRLVYGLIGLVMTLVVSGLVALVIIP